MTTAAHSAPAPASPAAPVTALGGASATKTTVLCSSITIGLSAWVGDFFSGTNPPAADVDGNGQVNLVDLSILVCCFFNANGSCP